MLQATVQAIAAFNLICTGTIRSGPIGVALPEKDGTPIETVYRIDLASGRWCSDECAATEPIAEMGFGEIVLRDRQTPTGSHVIRFVPALGQVTDTLIDGNNATLRGGACRPDAFGGFPATALDR